MVVGLGRGSSAWGFRQALGATILILLAAADASAGTASSLPFVKNGGLAGMWHMQAGDDSGWASPAFDDSQWRLVVLPSPWSEQGLVGHDGPVWYRREVILGAEPMAGDTAEDWGLMIGRTRFGSIEVRVEGQLVGTIGAGGWVPVPALRAVPIPSGLVDGRDRLLIALRVDRVGWISDRAAHSGPVGTDLVLAGHQEIVSRVEQQRHAELFESLPLLVAALLFLGGGLYFLYLWGRWGFGREYLWFGVVAALFAANTFLNSAWVWELTERFTTVVRLTELSGVLLPAAFIEFLWTLFRRPLGRLLRLYQAFFLVHSLAIVVTPTLGWVVDTQGVRWLAIVPLLGAGLVVTIVELMKGNRDARGVLIAGLLLGVAEVVAVVGYFTSWVPPLALEPLWGFGVLFAAIGLGLADRLHRMRRELAARCGESAEQVRQGTG